MFRFSNFISFFIKEIVFSHFVSKTFKVKLWNIVVLLEFDM